MSVARAESERGIRGRRPRGSAPGLERPVELAAGARGASPGRLGRDETPPRFVCHHCGRRLNPYTDGPRPGPLSRRTVRLMREWPVDQCIAITDWRLRRISGGFRPPRHLDGLGWGLAIVGAIGLAGGLLGVAAAAGGWTAETVDAVAAVPVLDALRWLADRLHLAAWVVVAGLLVLGVEWLRAPAFRPRWRRRRTVAAHCPDCLRRHHALVRWLIRLPFLVEVAGGLIRVGRTEDISTAGGRRRRSR